MSLRCALVTACVTLFVVPAYAEVSKEELEPLQRESDAALAKSAIIEVEALPSKLVCARFGGVRRGYLGSLHDCNEVVQHTRHFSSMPNVTASPFSCRCLRHVAAHRCSNISRKADLQVIRLSRSSGTDDCNASCRCLSLSSHIRCPKRASVARRRHVSTMDGVS